MTIKGVRSSLFHLKQLPTTGKLLLLLSLGSNLSCSKDKLQEDFNRLEGHYTWVYTPASDKSIWTNNTREITPDRCGFQAALHITPDGSIGFYQNGQLLTEAAYSIREKELRSGGTLYLHLKLKGAESKSWNINQEIKLTLQGDTQLLVTGYPYPAIDQAEHYWKDYTAGQNYFGKK